MTKRYHLFGIGNALLDTEYRVSEEFLSTHQIPKGRMSLIDSERRNALLDATDGEPFSVGAGGSVANSVYAAQGFGCRNYFAGIVRPDEVGITFFNELSKTGIDVLPPQVGEQGASGQCLIYVTPDGERSMNTSIGVADSFDSTDIPTAEIQKAQIVYVEGYLASSLAGRKAARTVIQTARSNNVRTSLTLADTSIVQSFRSELEYILKPGIDILFCNIEEALVWSNVSTLEATYDPMLNVASICVITLSEDGCIVLSRAADPLGVQGFRRSPMDSTGAGDLFAGAFLTGFVNDWDRLKCAQFANFAASKIVTQYGARLHTQDCYRKLLHEFDQASRKKGIS